MYNCDAMSRAVSPETRANIGLRLLWLREVLGHSQVEWSRALRISNIRLHKWETGKGLANIDTLITICDAAGVTMDYFFRGWLTADMNPSVLRALYESHHSELKLRTLPPVPLSGGQAPSTRRLIPKTPPS